jgi:hypothetical protein
MMIHEPSREKHDPLLFARFGKIEVNLPWRIISILIARSSKGQRNVSGYTLNHIVMWLFRYTLLSRIERAKQASHFGQEMYYIVRSF